MTKSESDHIYYSKNKDKIKNKVKQYQDKNREKITTKRHERYINNKETVAIKSKEYRTKNREKILAAKKLYRQNNQDKIKKYNREYELNNKTVISKKKNLYMKTRRANDIEFKLLTNLRRRLNHAITDGCKSKSTKELLGCDLITLRTHLENQFKPNMSWSNYGLNGWEVDHIKPCVLFDLTKESEQKICFNYNNLQPLWAKENRRKGANRV